MAVEGVSFDFEHPHAKPTDELQESYSHERGPIGPPSQEADDSDEYLCGNAGNAHPYANPGRDQDRSRADERIPAIGPARYVS